MMNEILISFAGFALVSSVTPGPNNLMLMASGANYGFRRTVPHMLGIGIGFSLMVLLVGVGLMGVFEAFPWVHMVLKTACAVYLLWLAWKIATATAAAPGEGRSGGRPMTFVEAALFQWVNPKAWAMALTAVTLYAPDRSFGAIVVIAAIFGAINLPTVSLWTVLGQGVRKFLANRRRLRMFNGAMAVLLILSVVPML